MSEAKSVSVPRQTLLDKLAEAMTEEQDTRAALETERDEREMECRERDALQRQVDQLREWLNRRVTRDQGLLICFSEVGGNPYYATCETNKRREYWKGLSREGTPADSLFAALNADAQEESDADGQ